jgi:hypothetical protein
MLIHLSIPILSTTVALDLSAPEGSTTVFCWPAILQARVFFVRLRAKFFETLKIRAPTLPVRAFLQQAQIALRAQLENVQKVAQPLRSGVKQQSGDTRPDSPFQEQLWSQHLAVHFWCDELLGCFSTLVRYNAIDCASLCRPFLCLVPNYQAICPVAIYQKKKYICQPRCLDFGTRGVRTPGTNSYVGRTPREQHTYRKSTPHSRKYRYRDAVTHTNLYNTLL